MQLANPLAVVTPTVDGPVLEVLARAEAEFTAPEIHRLAGSRSEDGIRKACARLARQGIVTQRRAGNAWMYSLNRQHLAADAIIRIADLRSTLFRRIREEFDKWETQPVYAALFGSAVRGDHHDSSDIDLFIVRPDDVDETGWDVHVGALATLITAWTGNDTRPFELTESEVLQSAGGEPTLVAIAEEGVTMAGKANWLAKALRHARSSQSRGADRT